MAPACPPHGPASLRQDGGARVDDMDRAGLKPAAIGLALLGLTVAHFVTPAERHAIHEVLFKATYLPVILAGLWFGMRGALAASGLTAGLYLVHIFGQLAGHGSHGLWTVLFDVGMFSAMSMVAGVLSDRRQQARREAEGRADELRETTRVLLRAEEELRRAERLRSLGELAAGLAHEIRNPLGGIKGAGEILARDGCPPETREEFRGVLISEIERLDRIVENVLRFARPQEGECASVELRSELEKVFLLLRARAKRGAIEFGLEVPAGLTVRAAPDLLRQVLLNVCLNALQAMPEGGRLLARASAGPPISLEIEDTGPGMPAEIRHRIFDPFVTGRPEGTGLGLATSYRIMQSLGGRIDVSRTGPEGTVMRIEFDG